MSQTFDPAAPSPDSAVESQKIRDNFLAIASSFSGSSPPNTNTALTGQLWFDTAVNLLKVFYGAQFEYVVKGQPHGQMDGLGNDDHPQYLLASGLRTAAGLTVTTGFKVDKIDLSELADSKATLWSQIRNGSFESYDTALLSKPPYWSLVGSPTLATDTSAPGDVGKALKITTASANEGLSQVVKVKPSRRYTLGVWAKATSGNSAKVIIQESADNITYSTLFTLTYAETSWTKQTKEFSVGASAKYVRIQFLSTSSIGSAWFDEATLNEGDINESYPVIEQSHDRFAEYTEYKDASGNNRNIGNIGVQSGRVNFSLSAVARQNIAVSFPSMFAHYLGAHATLLTTVTNALLVSCALGTTQGMTIEVRSASGSVTESGEVFWTAYGVRGSL